MINPAIEEGLTSLCLSVGGTGAQYSKKKQERGTYKKTERKSSYMVYDTKLSGDKNMVPLKVAKKAVFFIGTSSCPESRTRTCTDCRKGQEHEPIPD
jgi:hypothetical protein